jgi:hypothetical protein
VVARCSTHAGTARLAPKPIPRGYVLQMASINSGQAATSDWLQWLQRMTMSEGTGPSSEERHCADADGDHRFSNDEEPQSRHTHTKRQPKMMIAA